MAYTKYSLTPADNNAAPPNGAPEGMLPSAVNDTMRDMMAQIRDAGDGIRNGTYTMTAPVITGGSITGVALSGNTLTNPVITGGSINNTPIGATTASTGRFSDLTDTGLTSGRVIYAGTGGNLVDSGNLTFSGSQLTLGGNQVISVTDNSNAALRITQLGTGNALVVEDSTNPDATPFIVDPNGKTVVGNSAAVVTTESVSAQLQIHGTNDAGSQSINLWGSAVPQLQLNRAGAGGIGTYTALASGNSIGKISFGAADGTAFVRAAEILAQVDGTTGTNDMPSRLVFSTTADGASTPTERMRIDSAGRVRLNGTPVVTTGFTNSLPLTGGVTSFSTVIDGTVQPDSTSGVAYVRASTTTASNGGTPYTVTNLRIFQARQGAFHSDSTVNSQYGFLADSDIIGATNNYGFYSNIASGTNRWNFYANGTAANYFAGETTINSGLTIGRTAVTSPATTDGNVFSGTYTPTQVSTNTNVDAVTFSANQYMRVGSTVTVSGLIQINPTAATTATTVKFSLPIASAFTNSFQLGGAASSSSAGYYGTNNAAIMADADNDCVEMRLTPTHTTLEDYRYTFTYRIV